jgi:hypothetical protein
MTLESGVIVTKLTNFNFIQAKSGKNNKQVYM